MRYVEFAILGFGTGAVIAALALGLVVAYRASGVINFGHGAIAAWVAYTYYALRTAGDIPLPPLPFGPEFVDLGGEMDTLPALVLSLVVAALAGLLAHVAVFKPLRYAPTLAKVVASVGIMIFLQAAIVLRFGSRARLADHVLPDEPVTVLGTTLPVDRYLSLAIVAVLTLVLWLLYRYTRFGLATRAAAENERFATLLGIDADRQAAWNWMLASVLAGLVGIVASPIIGLAPSQLTLMVVPALGAALLGRMSSFVIAAAAGLAIGSAQSVLFLVEQNHSWVPDINLPQGLPFVVIALAMVVRGEALPSRGAITAERLPAAYAPPLTRLRFGAYGSLVSVAALTALFAPFAFRAGLNNTLVGIVLALSLVVVTGFVGQISLMQMALAGIAAFGVAEFGTDLGIPFPIDLVLAVVAAVSVGLLAAVPTVRTRGASLAIITLACGLAIEEFLFRHDGWFGTARFRSTDPPAVFGFEFGPNSSFPLGGGKVPTPAFGLFALAIVVLACAAVMRLRRSRLGEQMLAVRANERAAAAAGINVVAVKLVSFAIGSSVAGLAGALMAWKLGQFTADSFTVFASLTVLAFAYLGGISTVGGAVMAGTLFAEGIVVAVLEEWFGVELGSYTGYVAGFFLIVTAIYNREGIDGFQRKQFYSALEWLRARRGPAPSDGNGASAVGRAS